MNFKVSQFTAATIIWSALSLVWMSDFYPISLLAAASIVLSLFVQDRVTVSSRGLGILSAGALLICFICTRVIDRDSTGRFLGIGTISLAILGATLLTASLVIKKKGALVKAPLISALSILVACSVSIDLTSVAVIASVGLVLTVLALREALHLKQTFSIVIPMLLTMFLMGSLATLASWSENKVSYLASLFALTPSTGMSFPPTTSLSSLQRMGNSDVVVLRGYGEDPPTYLVGRTFTEFDTNSFWKWKTDKEVLSPTDQVLTNTSEGPRVLSLFLSEPSIAPHERADKSFRLEFPKSGNGFTIYAPANFHSVAIDLNRLHRYGDGMLQALAKDTFDGNYYLFPYQNGWKSQEVETLSKELEQECLALPDNTPDIVHQLAEQIAGKVTDPALKADFITNYLQQNFTYGYEYPFESTQTALEEFLTKKPPAHCEFFAASAALMLRSQGVPTRYINGFVLQEKSLTGKYYVVRLKHAHAWLEAYIPGKGWVTYDPTPPGVLDNPNNRAAIGKAILEWFSNVWRKFFYFFTLNPAEMLAEIRAFLAAWTWLDYLKIVALVALWGLWKRYRLRSKKTKNKSANALSYEPGRDERLTPTLEAVVELIQPQEWQRYQWETNAEWLRRLSLSNIESDAYLELSKFLEVYSKARFSPSPTDSFLRRVEELSLSLHQHLKGKSLEARERGQRLEAADVAADAEEISP